MSYLKERVAYLKGLAEGMQISETTNEGKLLNAILDVLDDFALNIEDIEDVQDQISEQVDTIDEDLSQIESVLFDEDDDDDEGYIFRDFECPYCKERIEVDEDMIDEDGSSIDCPNCHKKIELEWDCDCGCEHEE